jgi:hypothetical protein
MSDPGEDPRLVSVWCSMADHFLDTETRQNIPLTALRCVQAGLSLGDARRVWQFEVSPAVAFNVWDIAGEWAGWDQQWLAHRIRGFRKRCQRRPPGVFQWLRYRVRVHLMHSVWVSIERCMGALLAVPTAAGREQLAQDLGALAQHHFDFCPSDLSALPPDDRARIGALYPEPFRWLMAPALVSGEAGAADQRVQTALTLQSSRPRTGTP